MDVLTAFSIVALAALIHASFQLGVSMITLLSSHTTGKKMAAERSFRLVAAFLAGTVTMTTLIIATLSFIATSTLRHGTSALLWSAVAGLLIGVGFVVWIYYYRHGDGTSLWLTVRDCKPRERVREIHGYDSLIRDCCYHNVSAVADIPQRPVPHD